MEWRRAIAAGTAVVLVVGGMMTATSGVASVKSGSYVGTTSQVDQGAQPLNVGFQIPKSKSKVKIIYFEFLNIGCGKVTQTAGVRAKLKASGRFNYADADPVFQDGYIKGRFDGRNASGTAEFPSRCPGVITWTAKRQ